MRAKVEFKQPVCVLELSQKEFADLRTVIMQHTFKKHQGEGIGELGRWLEQVAPEMGDERSKVDASLDKLDEPI